ncbi:uncharacterized protein [Leptinotarsa decemlineata]|uniref:uncharacterized protein n=1 Tax=Leptinotarsa decemlineata TaxID=7539 RepID=UPI003D3083FC
MKLECIQVDGEKKMENLKAGEAILNTGMKLGSEEMFDSVQLDSLANVNAESTFTNGSTKIPKKRGRPKKKVKSDHIISEPVLTHPMEESMRGRKRKRVDYLELEDRGVNILKRGQSQEPQKNSSFDNDDNFIPTKKTSGKKKSKVSDSLIEIDRRGEEIPLKNEAENNIIKSEDTTVGTVNADVDTVNADVDTNSIIIPMDPSSVIPENEQTDRQSNEDVTENSNVTVKNKYTFNGHTSYMMNSVFSAAFGGDSSPSTSSQDSTKKKRKGRPKKDAVNTFSDEVEVTCVICSEIMPNREWFLHNVTKHNNLAWRKGESALNLDEDSVVKNKLKIILPKNKILTCQKCEQSYKDVNGFIIHREECEGILVNGLVTCAVCNLQVERKNWLNHKMKRHNNLAWRVGDFPLDLNDKEYVLSVLNNMYKMKKPLFCDRCETVKKSVIGFLSHRSQCGDHEAKVACDICRKMVLPVSMPSHIKLYHEKAKESPNQSNYFSVDYKISDHKRKAAKDALLIIDSLTKRTMNMDESQTVAYKKNPVDFKEEQFVIALLESELKKCLTIKCKFQNCIFWTDNVDTIVDHMNSCSNKPEEFYICTECFVIQLSEEDIRSHITDSHDLFLPIEDCEMETDSLSGECHENEQTTKKIKRKNDTSKLLKDSSFKVKPSFICNIPKKKRTLYAKAFSTTWEFCSKYYSEPTLFDNFCYSNLRWELLPEELVETYLPEDEESCDVARKSVSGFENILEQETEFRKFDLFEVVREDVHTTIYCGGPINALAWLPTPYTARNANQILAVAAGKNFDGKYSVKRNYNEPSVIQFWDFGLLANKGPYPEPSLLFFLAVDYGPIWYLEWCPSGCYDQTESEVGRTGLLAVAGSDFCVYIYLIPKVTEEQRELVYRGKPLLRLQIMRDLSEVDDPFYPTRISWSKASGHRHVAVGYTDGMVALYDLQTTSPFLRLRLDEDTDVIYPCKIIQAHSHYISVLSLIHLDGGTKYLLTGSFDRSVKLWDLPITHAITTNVKKIVTDGHWLTNWVSYVITSDESSSVNNLAHATIYPHRNYLSSPTIIGSSPTTITSITSSDWLNGFVHSSSGGEIVANFQHQLLYCYDSVKQKYLNKYIISYTKLVDKHKSPEVGALEYANKRKILKGVTRTEDDLLKSMENVPSYQYPEPLTYGGAKHKYGLVFCDLKLNSFNDFPESLQKKFTGHHEDLEVSNPTLYSLQKANKVCYNPNCQASLYFATGYQAGFVRVSYLKFLENDPQVKQSMK